MKNDSNVFNDGNGNLSDGLTGETAEIPKVKETEPEENDGKKPVMLFGHGFSRKQVCAAGAGILCAALLIGGGGYALSHAGWSGKPGVPAVSQSKDEEKQDMALTLEVKAEGWDADTSTPVIAHIEGADGEVDFYTAIVANKKVSVTVGESGIYNVALIPPVNADGSTYKAASGEVKAGKDDKKTSDTVITLEKVDADKVTKDDLTAIAKDVAEAVKKGDSTLTGERGVKVVNIFQTNISINPNADTDAVEKETEAAQETAREDKSDTKTPETSGGKRDDGKTDSKPSDGNGGSNNGGGENKPQHTHNWVAQTKTVHHDAVYNTVHHDAEYTTKHHDAVYKGVCICNNCGAQFDNESAFGEHSQTHFFDGCQSYHTANVVIQEAYDETVLVKDAYDEQVLVRAAWDETVTTGYKCSSCGATK